MSSSEIGNVGICYVHDQLFPLSFSSKHIGAVLRRLYKLNLWETSATLLLVTWIRTSIESILVNVFDTWSFFNMGLVLGYLSLAKSYRIRFDINKELGRFQYNFSNSDGLCFPASERVNRGEKISRSEMWMNYLMQYESERMKLDFSKVALRWYQAEKVYTHETRWRGGGTGQGNFSWQKMGKSHWSGGRCGKRHRRLSSQQGHDWEWGRKKWILR